MAYLYAIPIEDFDSSLQLCLLIDEDKRKKYSNNGTAAKNSSDTALFNTLAAIK